MNNISKTTIWIIGIIIAIFGLIAWSAALQKDNPDIISRKGIHWHPQVHIFVDDVEQVLPANLGLQNGHEPMHTHGEDADDGVVHLEFNGRVTKDNVRLKQFFVMWNKDMTDFGTLEKMTVNDMENLEHGEYVLQHEDIVKLYFKSK